MPDVATEAAPAPVAGARPAGWCAALLTFLSPGVGHVYAGRIRRGVAWFAAAVVLDGVLLACALRLPLEGGALLAALAGLLVGFLSVAAWDAGRCARGSGPHSAGLGARALVLLAALGVTALLSFGIARLVSLAAEVFFLPTASMEPTLRSGDHVLVDKTAYGTDRGPQRGDLVIYRYPKDRTRTFVKRVVGLPGDAVEVRDDKVFVADRPVGVALPVGGEEPTTVPADSYYVVGDNTRSSIDSRHVDHGFVPRPDVLGRVVLVLWSTDEVRAVHWDRVGLRPR
jgi:signal peptidase I